MVSHISERGATGAEMASISVGAAGKPPSQQPDRPNTGSEAHMDTLDVVETQDMPGPKTKIFIIGMFCILAAISAGLQIEGGTEVQSTFPMLLIHTKMLIFSRFFAASVKITWMIGLGFSRDEIQRYLSKSVYNLGAWCRKYGDRRLNICDGMCRKIPHLAWGCMSLYAWYQFSERDAVAAANKSMQYDIISGSLTVLFDVGGLMYFDVMPLTWIWAGNQRIRDGRSRRLNVIAVILSVLPSNLVLQAAINLYLCRNRLYPVLEQNLIRSILYLPAFVGDAFAELVGVFGTHRFKVTGIGEINSKSIEGCVGFVVATLVGAAFFCNKYDADYSWYVFSLVVTMLTMLCETFTPRGFDNATIPVVGFFCALVFGYMR